LDDYRGLLNSAWVGGMMAASAILLLSLFGFYLVKNAIERDIQTGVGQIIATSPISQPFFLLGKWLSNWAVLAALVGILALAAVVMQLLGGESAQFDLTRTSRNQTSLCKKQKH
jgi:ABC-type transport system involved in multi-copper enzyme maturation permease subunit